MKELVKKKKVRGGHCAHATKLLGTAIEVLEYYDGTEKNSLMQTKIALTEKLETLRRLDDMILDLVSAEDDGEEKIAAEIEDSENIKAEIFGVVVEIDEELRDNSAIVTPTGQPLASSPAKSEKAAKVPLPKLEVRKFYGMIYEWQEFWDSYQSAIHQNDSLSDIGKFSYLRGLIEVPAKASIAGGVCPNRGKLQRSD